MVTGSGSSLGQQMTRHLSGTGARIVTVGSCEADIVVELGAPSGRSAMIRGVAAWTGGVIDAIVATAVCDHDGAASIQHSYFAPVFAIASMRRLLAGSPSPRAIAVTASPTAPTPDAALVEACLSGDEGRAIELADRLGAEGPGLVAASAACALQQWLSRHAPTREWGGRGIPLVGVAATTSDLEEEDEADLAAFVTQLTVAPRLPMTGSWPVPYAGRRKTPATAVAGSASSSSALQGRSLPYGSMRV